MKTNNINCNHIKYKRNRLRRIMISILLVGSISLVGCTSSSESGTESTEEFTSGTTDSSTEVTSDYTVTTTKTTSGDTEAYTDLFAMDTYMSLTAYGDKAADAVDAAAKEIIRLDGVLSTGDGSSEVAKLNANGGGELSEDAEYLLKKSIELYSETDGLFDIAIYPVMEAWGFPTQNYQVPENQELQELLRLTDASKIAYDVENSSVSFGIEGMKIDFGGIAKGYTSSRIMKIYEKYGVTSGLTNLGGNVQVLGTKTDGSLWKVGIQDPDSEEDYLGALSIRDKAVITSGGYERYFEQDGKTYHHIIDPRTGYPAENGLVSVSIVSDDGTLADGLSTSLFVMGKDEALEFWKNHSDEFDAILETDDGTLYVTEGLEDDFTSTSHEMKIVKSN